MKNNYSKRAVCARKLLISLTSIIFVFLLSVMTLTACGGGSISDIVIKDSDMPRTTYVQGQELDLTGGVLTVLNGSSESSVPLTSPEVSVSGYDKAVTGKQTVTVTYQEKTTTFEVTVVARMVADGFKSEYFIGDKFDNTQGRLKITKDDGKTTTVSLDSELVTIKNFATDKAGTVAVTAVYNDGAGTSYEAVFNVTVYEISDVTFTKPSKTVYASHDTELSLSGGYFTVKASGTSLSSYVPLTHDMYTGFDLSAATAAHRKDPLTQTVVFTYAGKSFDFKISILYSGVSVVKDAAKALADVEISGRDFTLDPELSAIAVDAATEYFKLTAPRKALIDKEDVLKVIRPAAFCVTKALDEAALKFDGVFKIDPKTGNLLIDSESYDRLKSALKEFENREDPFHVYVSVLNDMKEEFAEIPLFEEIVDATPTTFTVATFVKAPSDDELTFYIDLFKYMLSLSDILKPVPDNWTQETLGQYKDAIVEAFNYITKSKYIGPNFNGVYNSVSKWRANNDFLDIIYTYYLYVVGDTNAFFESINSQNGLLLHLPGELQVWYTFLSNGAYELRIMQENYKNPSIYMYDTTKFMFYYAKTVETAEKIKASDNKLHRDIYNILGGDMFTYSVLEHPHSLGYLYHVHVMAESEAFANVWNSYLALASEYFEGKLDLVEDSALFNDLLTRISEMTPGEFYGFICSLNFLYGGEKTEFNAFDYEDSKVYSTLAYLMAYYDVVNFGNDSRVLMQFLLAIEKCASIETSSSGLEEFRTEMGEFLTKFNALSPENRDKFLGMARPLYNKYVDLYNTLGGTAIPDLGTSADKYNELKDTINDAYDVLAEIFKEGVEDSKKQYYYGLFYAVAEKAIKLHDDLLKNGTDGARKALVTVEYDFGANGTMAMDTAILKIKSEFYYRLTFMTLNLGTKDQPLNVSLWLSYYALDVRGFLTNASDTMLKFFRGEKIEKSEITALISAFRELDNTSKSMLYVIGIDVYYDTLLHYFSDSVDRELARTLLQTEIGCVEYYRDTTDTGRFDYFKKIITDAQTAYNALSTSEQDALDPILKEFYEYYLGIYNSISK